MHRGKETEKNESGDADQIEDAVHETIETYETGEVVVVDCIEEVSWNEQKQQRFEQAEAGV